MEKARVAFTRSFFAADGSAAYPGYEIESLRCDPRVEVSRLDNGERLRPEELTGLDVLVTAVGEAELTAESLPEDNRLALIARAGAGFDDIDVAACSARAVALVNAADAVRRPTAVAALTLILALATRLLDKHRITREGPAAWDRIQDYLSLDLRGKTLGVVGLGNIGRELIALARPLDLRVVGHDPYLTPEAAAGLDIELLELEALLARADVVSLHCLLTDETRHLIDGRRLALMKPTAFLVNAARGGVIDQAALIDCLRARRIAGAGLDVSEPEPLPADHPLLGLDNVVFGAHALCWTESLSADTAAANIAAIQALLDGRPIRGLVDRAVLDDAAWRRKAEALRARLGG
jgi:phosphoglycerate dehydrogenase-like enzyme